MSTESKGGQEDLEAFRVALKSKVVEYSTAAYITYSSQDENAAENARIKTEKRDQLYLVILEECAKQLRETPNKEALLGIIDDELLHYHYRSGAILFTDQDKMKFYRDLLLKI